MASVALGQRALLRGRIAPRRETPQLDRAIVRFPDEPQLWLPKLVVAVPVDMTLFMDTSGGTNCASRPPRASTR